MLAVGLTNWVNFISAFTSFVSSLCLSAAIIGDFAFPDSISAPAPTPNTDYCFLPLYFPPKKVLCLCIFLPCHVYIPSIHSTQGVNPPGYCSPKIYTSQSKDVQRHLGPWWAENIQVISVVNRCNLIHKGFSKDDFVGHGTFLVWQVWQLGKHICWVVCTLSTLQYTVGGWKMHKKQLARASWLEQEQVRKCSKLLLFVQITSTAPARQLLSGKEVSL